MIHQKHTGLYNILILLHLLYSYQAKDVYNK